MNLLLSTRITPNKYQSSKPVFLRDTKLKGFAIKVNPSGVHRFIVEVRKEGKTKRTTIGTFGEIPITEAREIAGGVLSEYKSSNIASQPDSNESSKLSPQITITELFEEYLVAKNIKETTADDYNRTLNHLFKPLNRPIDTITRFQIKEWYLALKSTPTQANRCYRVMNSLYNYAMQVGYIESNPFIIVKTLKYKTKPKETYLEPVSELPKLWKSLCSYKGRVGSLSTLKMIKMYLLTGMRKKELYRVLVKNNGKTKSLVVKDTKNGEELILPVVDIMQSEGLLDIFDDISELPRDIRAVMAVVCKNAGVRYVSLHSLRRSVASLCVYLGVSIADIKKLLNHSTSSDVTLRHYIRYQPEYLLPVMKKIEKYYKELS